MPGLFPALRVSGLGFTRAGRSTLVISALSVYSINKKQIAHSTLIRAILAEH